MDIMSTHTVLEPGALAYMALADGDRDYARELFARQDRITALRRHETNPSTQGT